MNTPQDIPVLFITLCVVAVALIAAWMFLWAIEWLAALALWGYLLFQNCGFYKHWQHKRTLRAVDKMTDKMRRNS